MVHIKNLRKKLEKDIQEIDSFIASSFLTFLNYPVNFLFFINTRAMSEPHRAVNPDAKEARVKMIVTLNDGSTEKLQAYFSRADSGNAWTFKGLGKLSPGLFPQTY